MKRVNAMRNAANKSREIAKQARLGGAKIRENGPEAPDEADQP
jgi:hypothetical protein